MTPQTRTISRILTVFTLVSLVTACRYDATGVEPSPTARDRLWQATEHLELQPAACFLEVNQRALPLIRGSVDVAADLVGTLQLVAADIQLGDIVVPATTDVPVELHFTNVRISLAKPVNAQTEWSVAGDAGFAHVDADVVLDWSLVAPNGDIVPLAPQRIKGLALDLDVFDSQGGRLTATLYGEIDGPFWNWAGLLEMSDLTVDLRAEAVD